MLQIPHTEITAQISRLRVVFGTRATSIDLAADCSLGEIAEAAGKLIDQRERGREDVFVSWTARQGAQA
jgi:hypothetical protein